MLFFETAEKFWKSAARSFFLSKETNRTDKSPRSVPPSARFPKRQRGARREDSSKRVRSARREDSSKRVRGAQKGGGGRRPAREARRRSGEGHGSAAGVVGAGRRRVRLPLQGGAHRRLRRGEVQPALSLHQEQLRPRLQVHHRSRVRHPHPPGPPILLFYPSPLPCLSVPVSCLSNL